MDADDDARDPFVVILDADEIAGRERERGVPALLRNRRGALRDGTLARLSLRNFRAIDPALREDEIERAAIDAVGAAPPCRGRASVSAGGRSCGALSISSRDLWRVRRREAWR